MTTIRYSRYVLVNEDSCTIVWHESLLNAEKDKKANGGTIYDFDTDNPITIENALLAVRKRMGVE